MTEKRFKCVSDYDWWGVIDTTGEIKGEYDNDCFSTYTVVDLLNELAEENKKLKQVAEKNKKLKQEIASENSILWNEILILRKQGALPSDAFENYLNDLKNKKKLKVILHG